MSDGVWKVTPSPDVPDDESDVGEPTLRGFCRVPRVRLDTGVECVGAATTIGVATGRGLTAAVKVVVGRAALDGAGCFKMPRGISGTSSTGNDVVRLGVDGVRLPRLAAATDARDGGRGSSGVAAEMRRTWAWLRAAKTSSEPSVRSMAD